MKHFSLFVAIILSSTFVKAGTCNPYPGADRKNDPCYKKATEITRCAYRVKQTFDNQESFCCENVDSATTTAFKVTQAIDPTNDITQLVYLVELNDNGNDCFITNLSVIDEE